MPITAPQVVSSNTKPTAEENKVLFPGVKIAAGVIGVGLIALASYVIYTATSGRIKHKNNPILTPETTISKPVEEIKEWAVNAFKEVGNFNKGKAV